MNHFGCSLSLQGRYLTIALIACAIFAIPSHAFGQACGCGHVTLEELDEIGITDCGCSVGGCGDLNDMTTSDWLGIRIYLSRMYTESSPCSVTYEVGDVYLTSAHAVNAVLEPPSECLAQQPQGCDDNIIDLDSCYELTIPGCYSFLWGFGDCGRFPPCAPAPTYYDDELEEEVPNPCVAAGGYLTANFEVRDEDCPSKIDVDKSSIPADGISTAQATAVGIDNPIWSLHGDTKGAHISPKTGVVQAGNQRGSITVQSQQGDCKKRRRLKLGSDCENGKDCKGKKCGAGSGKAKLGSIDFSIDLGVTAGGKHGGEIYLYSDSLNQFACTACALEVQPPDEFNPSDPFSDFEVTFSNGILSRVVAHEVVATVGWLKKSDIGDAETGTAVDIYRREDYDAHFGDLDAIDPFIRWQLHFFPATGSDEASYLTIKKILDPEGALEVEVEYHYRAVDPYETSTLFEGDGSEYWLSTIPANGTPSEVYQITEYNNEEGCMERRTYYSTGSENAACSEIVFGSEPLLIPSGTACTVERYDVIPTGAYEDSSGRHLVENRVVVYRDESYYTPVIGESGYELKSSITRWGFYGDVENGLTVPDINVGRLKWQVNPDGSWEWFEYNNRGLLVVHTRSHGASTFEDLEGPNGIEAPTDPDQFHTLRYEYLEEPTSSDPEPLRPRVVVEWIAGVVVGKTFYSYSFTSNDVIVETEERCVSESADPGDPDNLRTEREYEGTPTGRIADGPTALRRVKHADGREDVFVYTSGGYTRHIPPDSDFGQGSGYIRTIVDHYADTGHVANMTTREVIINNLAGDTVCSEEFVRTSAGGFERIGWTVFEYDDYRHLLRVEESNGSVTVNDWDCCVLNYSADPAGIRTEYEMDSLGRILQEKVIGVSNATLNGVAVPSQATRINKYCYDHDSKVVYEAQEADGSPLQILSYTLYDETGQIATDIDGSGIAAVHRHESLEGGGSRSTTLYATGLIRVVDYRPDGQIESVTGTAGPAQYYTYGVESDGRSWARITTGHPETGPWVKTYYDLLGREVREERPGKGGEDTISVDRTYNSKGQLVRIDASWNDWVPDGQGGGAFSVNDAPGDMLYEYNALGDIVMSVVDVDGDGVVDMNGPDLITETSESYEKDSSNNWWRQTSSFVRGQVQGVWTNIPVGTTRTLLTGFDTKDPNSGDGAVVTAYSETIDSHGNSTVTMTLVDRANKVTEVRTISPTSTEAIVAVEYNGLLQYTKDSAGLLTQYQYDALGRRIKTTDSRGNSTTTVYNDRNQVEKIYDEDGRETEFAYHSVNGRRLSVKNDVGKYTYFGYDDTRYGQLYRVWGDVPQPVEIGFDAYGRRTSLKTFQSDGSLGGIWTGSTWPSSTPTAAITTWDYDDLAGLLISKTYDDQSVVEYDYYPTLKLKTRTWARGVTTTYSYNAIGRLASISYSDSTPTLSFTYTHLGQLETVTDAGGVRTFSYDLFDLTSEAMDGDAALETHDFIITRHYQDGSGVPGRYEGFTVGSDAQTPDDLYESNYGFDAFGRLKSVNGTALPAGGVEYTYKQDAALVEKTEYKDAQAAVLASSTRAFENDRDLLSSIENKWIAGGASTISKYEYGNDDLGRRTHVINTGSAFAASTHNRWNYNDRNELTNAARFEGVDPEEQSPTLIPDQDFAFNYDAIGNRLSGTLPGDLRASYSRNSLNQYPSIEHLAIGSAYDVTEKQMIEGSNIDTLRYFGNAVAISGEYMLVGAYNEDDTSNDVGVVHVFKFANGAWSEQAQLVAGDANTGDQFGWSVAIDGLYAVIGAPGDDEKGTNAGAVYVFKRNGTSWTQEDKLFDASTAAGDALGQSVDIRENVIVAGAYLDDFQVSGSNQINAGSVYVWRRDVQNQWQSDAWLTAPQSPTNDANTADSFGNSVAISGLWIIVGAYGDDGAASGAGAAYLYEYVSGTWTYRQKLTASDAGSSDQFGWSVALDGDLAVVGAPLDNDMGNDSGSGYVFRRSGSTWTQESKLTASDGAATDQFGYAVSVKQGSFGEEGAATILIGAFQDDDDGTNTGSAYVWRWVDSAWDYAMKLNAGTPDAGANFGKAVALGGSTGSGDGVLAVVGALWYDHPGSGFSIDRSGAAYVYDGVTGLSSETLVYDADGNLVDDGETYYFYDAENRLREMRPKAPHGGDSRLLFTYDYMGRRVRRLTEVFCDMPGGDCQQVMLSDPLNQSLSSAYLAPAEDMRFIYDGWNVVMERVCPNPCEAEVTRAKYAWGLDLSGLNGAGASGDAQAAIHGAGGIGGLLAMEASYAPEFDDAPKFLYFYDGNGNVGQLVTIDSGTPVQDPQEPVWYLPEGQIVAKYEYDPYGATLLNSDELGFGQGIYNPFRFSTKYYEVQPTSSGNSLLEALELTGTAAGERGLYYYGYRYYSPRLGRWMNRDPIGERGGLNVYSFISNRPTDLIDADGREPKGDCKCCCCPNKSVGLIPVPGGFITVGNFDSNIDRTINSPKEKGHEFRVSGKVEYHAIDPKTEREGNCQLKWFEYSDKKTAVNQGQTNQWHDGYKRNPKDPAFKNWNGMLRSHPCPGIARFELKDQPKVSDTGIGFNATDANESFHDGRTLYIVIEVRAAPKCNCPIPVQRMLIRQKIYGGDHEPTMDGLIDIEDERLDGRPLPPLPTN